MTKDRNPGFLSHLLNQTESEYKARQDQSEILEFIRSAIITDKVSNSAPFEAEELALIADAKLILDESAPTLDAILSDIDDPQLREKLLSSFNQALLYSYCLGNYSTPSRSVGDLLIQKQRARQAAKAREARSKKPAETALLNAIRAECGTGFIQRPMKKAEEISSGVNKRLASADFAPVSPYVIYRRLKKFLRS